MNKNLKHHLTLVKENTKKLLLLFVVILSATMINAQISTASQTTINKLRVLYKQIKNPEITFNRFVEINSHIYANGGRGEASRDAALLAPQDTYCSKVRTYCGNGDFEAGLDQNQWTGAYGTDFTGILPNPFTLTYGFLAGAINSGSARQTIVLNTSGNDPLVPIPLVAANGGTRSLRLGNAVNGNGTEVLAKTLVVDPNETILSFFYAVVFEDPNHAFNDQPAFSVRAYDCATGLELPNVCNLGNNSNVVVSDASNPFFQSANSGTIAYRNWSLAQINLSAHVGKTVIIVFETKDCNLGGHFGYAYLDNIFSNQCPVGGPILTGQGSISLNTANTSSCGVGQICANYLLPTTSTTTGSTNITLSIYQAGALVTTLTSGVLSSGTSYCFNVNPASLGLNSALGGFDYALTGNFTLSGFSLSPIVVGNPPNGQVSGANNDYLITCPSLNVYYSKATGDLHNVLTWGVNPDGSGANPPDFTAGKTFVLANRPGVYTMTNDWTVGGTIVNAAGNQLQINGFTLSEAALTGAGTLTGSLTSNLIVTGTTGGDAGTLNFTAGNASLYNFTLNRTGAGASATVGSTLLSIYNVLTLTNGTLNTNNALTLKSTVANTARVAPVITGAIAGNVTVERYIPARRAWRILAAPVGGTQTISAAWQEGATTSSVNPDPSPGFGTYITEGSPANGFDQNPFVALMSSKRYVSATNNWTNLANTNATSVNADAYMLFVRGNRGTALGYNSVPATITTLRCNGPLKVGDQVFPVSGTGFTAIPNPYASPINFATLTKNGVQDNFYVWDPKVGGTNGVGAYVTVSFNGTSYDVSSNAISPESQFIQSGQGFLVSATTAGVAGSLTIKESDKSNTAAADVFRTVSGNNNFTISNAPVFADPTQGNGLRLQLQTLNSDNTPAILDEVFASYKPEYSNKVDKWDAVKATNMAENLGMVREDKTLAIERKLVPSDGEVINLKLWNTEPKNYILEINPVNLSSTGLFVYLEDKYLKTFTPVSLNKISSVSFSITNNSASARADRFNIVFSKNNKLTTDLITKTNITAYPNPVTGRNFNLQFTDQPSGTYLVTLVNGAGHVVFERSIQYIEGSVVKMITLDKKLAPGVYQLQVLGNHFKATSKILSY